MLTEINGLIIDIYQKSLCYDLVAFREHVCNSINKVLPFDSIDWHHINNEGITLTAICTSPQSSINCQCDNFIPSPKNFTLHRKMLLHDDYSASKPTTINYEQYQLSAITTTSKTKPGHLLKLSRQAKSPQFTEHDKRIFELLIPHLVAGFSMILMNRFKESNGNKVTGIIDKTKNIIEANPAFYSLFSDIIKQQKLLLDIVMQPQLCIHKGLQYKVTQSADFYVICADTAIESLLTQQEHNVMKLIATGASNKVIAKTLQLSPSTINNHLTHIFNKLNVNSRISAIKHWKQYDNK